MQSAWKKALNTKTNWNRSDCPSPEALENKLDSINCTSPSSIENGAVCIGKNTPISDNSRDKILNALAQLIPWRKGPFQLFDIPVDAEWRSDLKWNRLLPHLPYIYDKKVLDVGCSNGYYMWRLLEHSPAFVLGIDPGERFYLQFRLMQYYAKSPNLFFEIMGLDDLKGVSNYFDLILCMGILYHRRDPLSSLKLLFDMLSPSGSLVLETLILDGDNDLCLCPYPTYAKMPNTFFIPSAKVLKNWIYRAGFRKMTEIDRSDTTNVEQRHTGYCDEKWETLEQFLNPENPKITVEGYQAPLRSMWLCTK